MLKRERQQKILDILAKEKQITVSEIIKTLKVSDMTVRRDFEELASKGLLIRLHGGARSITNKDQEKSHLEKHDIQTTEKKEIAKLGAQFINDSETIFIGPGTTLEYLASQLIDRKLRVVTNSLPVFNILNQAKHIDLILIGGEYRDITGAFVGSIPMDNLQKMHFAKAFVSSNAITENTITTYSEDEGKVQKLALDGAIEKYLLIDHSKFGKYDFFNFYNVHNLDYILTNKQLSKHYQELFKTKVNLVLA